MNHGTRTCYEYHKCRCDLCREAMAAIQKIRRARRAEKAREYAKTYYAAHSTDLLDRRKQERLTSTAQRDHLQAWRQANPDRVKANAATYRAAHPGGNSAITAEWRKNNPARVRAVQAAWRSKNPEKCRESSTNRISRVKHAFVERIDPAIVFERDAGVCQICRGPIGDGKWHIDHVIPIARGGEHSYTNVQLAHARCNLVKGARLEVLS